MDDSWLNNPALSGIDLAKLQMIQSMAVQGAGKNPSSLLPFLMAASKSSKKKGMQFSEEEIHTIAEVLKSGKSKEEVARIDQMLALAKLLKK